MKRELRALLKKSPDLYHTELSAEQSLMIIKAIANDTNCGFSEDAKINLIRSFTTNWLSVKGALEFIVLHW